MIARTLRAQNALASRCCTDTRALSGGARLALALGSLRDGGRRWAATASPTTQTRFEFTTRAHARFALVDALDCMQRLMKE